MLMEAVLVHVLTPPLDDLPSALTIYLVMHWPLPLKLLLPNSKLFSKAQHYNSNLNRPAQPRPPTKPRPLTANESRTG